MKDRMSAKERMHGAARVGLGIDPLSKAAGKPSKIQPTDDERKVYLRSKIDGTLRRAAKRAAGTDSYVPNWLEGVDCTSDDAVVQAASDYIAADAVESTIYNDSLLRAIRAAGGVGQLPTLVRERWAICKAKAVVAGNAGAATGASPNGGYPDVVEM